MKEELTANQLELLSVLWTLEGATVQEVHEAMLERREIAPATVATMLNRLCKDGVVARERDGRQYRYRALVARGELQRSLLRGLLDRLFQGDASALLSHLVRSKDVSESDLEKAQRLIRQHRNDEESST